MKFQRVWALLGLCVALSPAWAATLIVDGASTAANDANPGTAAAPLKTISAAAKMVKPGDTVVVHPGLYREKVTLTVSGEEGKPITFRSEVPHAAVISGADPVTDWRDEGMGVWSASVPKIAFNKYDTEQWVYVDDFPLLRAASRAQLLPGMFMLDTDAKRLYFAPEEGMTPAQLNVEFAYREGLISPTVINRIPITLNDIQIIGFTVTKNADWWRGEAAIQVAGQRWLVENNLVSWSSCGGFSAGPSNHCVIRNNRFEWAGQLGVGGSNNINLDFENNKVLYSNWRRFRTSWEAGGSKFSGTLDSHVANNEFAYSHGWALWYDISNTGNLMQGNVVHDVMSGAGLFTEISWSDIIRDNVVFNSEYGVCVGESPNTLIHRNILFNNGIGIRMRGDYSRATEGTKAVDITESAKEVARIPGIDPLRAERWASDRLLFTVAPRSHMTDNCAIWENVIFNNTLNYSEERDYANPSPKDPYISNFSDFNVWYNQDSRANIGGRGKYDDFATWQKVSGRDAHSVFANPLTEPDKLPAWALAKKEIWQQQYRPYDEVNKLRLGAIASPMTAILIGRIMRSPLLEEVKFSNPVLKAYLIEVEGQRTLAVWSTQEAGRQYLRLGTGQQSVTLENGYLGQKPVTLANGMVDLAITWVPQYIRGVGQTVTEVRSGVLSVPGFNMPDKAVPVTAAFINAAKTAQPLTVNFAVGKGFTAQPASVKRTLAPNEQAEITINLVPDGTVRLGTAQVRMEATLDTEKMVRATSFLVGESSGVVPNAGSGYTFIRFSVDGNLNDWAHLITPVPLGTITDRSQVVSGNAAGWKGPKDTSAKVYAAWRDTELYLGIVVSDDTVIPTPAGSDPTQHDAIQLFLDGRSNDMQFQTRPGDGCFQIAVSPATTGGNPSAVKVTGKQIDGLQAKTSHTNDGYIVEMMIPLTEKNFPAGEWKIGRDMRFALLLTDRDDAAQPIKHTLGWGANANTATDCTSWVTVKFGQ